MKRQGMLALLLFCTAVYAHAAEDLWQLRDRSNVKQVHIDSAKVIQQATLAGNAGTASALAADPANCSAGSAPLGITAAGVAEGCFDVETDAEASSHEGNASAHHAATTNTNAETICSGTGNYLDGEGNCDPLITDTGAPHGNGANCTVNQFNKGVDASGAAESCASLLDADIPQAITISGGSIGTSVILLETSVTPTPTVEAEIEWDSNDNRIVVGNGEGGQVTFFSGAHTAGHSNGANCSAGSAPLGVDAVGAVEGCFDVETGAEATSHEGNSSAHHTATVNTDAASKCSGTTTYLDGENNCDDLDSVYQAADADLDDLADGSLTATKLDIIQLIDTAANICQATPIDAIKWAYATDEFDIYTATGTDKAQWRNIRTGKGACL